MQDVFEPMNFLGEVFEPMNFDGEVFEPMNFNGEDSVYFEGDEYSNFANFNVLKRNVVKNTGKLVSAPRKLMVKTAPKVVSVIRKEPVVTIKTIVVPKSIQSIIRGNNNKPFVVTPLDAKFKPLGKVLFPVKLNSLVVSKPLVKPSVKINNVKNIISELSKKTNKNVVAPAVLTPSSISAVTETIVMDNNNKPFLISPVNSVKSEEYKKDTLSKPNVVLSITDKNFPETFSVKDAKGDNMEVAKAITQENIKPKSEVISTESTPDAKEGGENKDLTVKSNKKLYIGAGILAVGVIAFLMFKNKK